MKLKESHRLLLKNTLEAAKVELEGLEKDNQWFVSQVVEDIEACLALLSDGEDVL